MAGDSFDELMGPAPTRATRGSKNPPTPPRAPRDSQVRRSSGGGAPPPAAAFTKSSSLGSRTPARNSSNNAAFNSSGAAVSLPKRWSQYEADAERDAAGATANAVYMASSAAASREGSRCGSVASRTSGSAFEDDDMMMDYEEDRISTSSSSQFEIGSPGRKGAVTSKSFEEDEDEEAIGRAYDVDHDNIRQEALRMLEVADADKHYSVHRTITGGFTAHPKSMGSQKPRALAGLNFVANRKNEGKRFSDYATKPTSSSSKSSYEYGDDSVVDVVGLEERSASAAAKTESSDDSKSNWSSRYSIDNTLLAMSGGAVSKSKRDSTERKEQRERLSKLNLFGSSPTAGSQVFGSGFSFRQKHVFGQQNVNANLQYDASGAADSLPPANPRLKTWQEQLLKKQRQRRWMLAICLGLVCAIVPVATILTLRSKSSSTTVASSSTATVTDLPSDGLPSDGVTFFVTGDSPFNGMDEVLLMKHLAKSSHSTHFAVHLGNIQNAAVDKCPAHQYQKVADMLEDCSPKPMFVVPGEEDWVKCPDREAAWEHWWENFEFFDKRWDNVKHVKPFHVTRQSSQLENWAFVHGGVLFIGVHVVNAENNAVDHAEFNARNQANFQWIEAESNSHHHEISAVVVFGNARSGWDVNKSFFAPLEEFWRGWDKPALYVHAADGKGKNEFYKPFLDLDHVQAAQVESGWNIPPLRINVGPRDDPFVFG